MNYSNREGTSFWLMALIWSLLDLCFFACADPPVNNTAIIELRTVGGSILFDGVLMSHPDTTITRERPDSLSIKGRGVEDAIIWVDDQPLSFPRNDRNFDWTIYLPKK
jgi:hypothetical protein